MIVFIVPVKHPINSASYLHVWRLLNDTLYSICGQKDAPFRVIVVCNRILPLFHSKELIAKQTEFISVKYDPISQTGMYGVRVDKGCKQIVGVLMAERYDPQYVMFVDADDFIGNDIALHTASHPGCNGWIINKGFVMIADKMRNLDAFGSFCGTSNIYAYHLLRKLIAPGILIEDGRNEILEKMDKYNLFYVFGSHKFAREYGDKVNRPLSEFPGRSAVWNQSTGENHSSYAGTPSAFNEEQQRGDKNWRVITHDQRAYFSLPLPQQRLTVQEQIAPFIRGYFIEPVKNRLLRPVKKLSSIRRKIRWSSQVVQAIFLHLPKAAGSSIERVCSDERIPIDTLNQAWCKIDAHAAEFEGWFKFGFVRNPWDKMVSSWQMFSTWRRPEWFPVLPFEEFLKIAFAPREPEKISCERVWKKKDGNPEEMAYYRDQYLMSIHNHSLYQCHPFYKMFDQSGKQLVDFVGRFEYLQSDFDKICEIVGIHPRKLPHLNSSEHKHYSFYYDDETRNLVDEYYHQDIEQFGYHFEDNAK